MARLILLPLLLLAACNQQAADGYRYEKTEFDRRTVTITQVSMPSLAALQREATRKGIKLKDREVMAFGLVDPILPVCTIYFVDPAKSYKPEWIGHETVHCFRGRWHS